MTCAELKGTSVVASNGKRIAGAIEFPEIFGNKDALKRALVALQRGPIRFRRDNVIACEGEAADYLFFVVSGVVRHCKTFESGVRNIVAFYLPGDLFGWNDDALSVEAAADAMVLFIKRAGLLSIALQESRVASFLLATTTNDLRRSHEHALLINKSATCRIATFLADLWTRSGKLQYLDLPVSHPLSPKGMIDHLRLRQPIFRKSATYGHFGREDVDFTWERVDAIDELQAKAA